MCSHAAVLSEDKQNYSFLESRVIYYMYVLSIMYKRKKEIYYIYERERMYLFFKQNLLFVIQTIHSVGLQAASEGSQKGN